MLAISSLPQNPSRILVAKGVRDAEARLIEEVLTRESQRASDLAALRQPIQIVVPSSSLRKHLAAALVRRAGHSLLGVRLHTLRGVAQRIVEGSEAGSAKSDRLFPLLCRREVAKEPALREALEELEDGFGAVVGTLSDLLDAGLEIPLDEALLESLEELARPVGKAKTAQGESKQGGKSAVLSRAQELVRVAARLGPALSALGGERTGDLYRRAADRYSSSPEDSFPASDIFIFGFSDVTGVAGDLLERLVSYGNAHVVLDLPPDPAHPQVLDAGTVFAERFSQRFGALFNVSEVMSAQGEESLATLPAPTFRCFQAPGSRAEVEEVASRVRGLLDSGVAAEDIGLVIRQVGPYASDLRAVFRDRGIPFSAPGELGAMGSAGRKLSNLRQVLRNREEVGVEPWLDVLASLSKEGRACPLTVRRREVLRVAAHEAGAARLVNLAQLSKHAVRAPLSSRGMGLSRKETEDGKVLWQALRSRPQPEEWSALLAGAEKLSTAWEDWPEEGSWGEHCEALQHFLTEVLGWGSESCPELFARVLERLRALESEAPGEWQMARGEALSMVSQLLVELEEEQLDPLGGEGAGVQVHSVTDARSISFEHLFLLGLNRDQFPRTIREDPLLPDWLRQPMGQLLPELPLKLKAVDEEKYLFAQLLSAASEITLSWQCVDNAGKELALSPLVMRLQIEGLLPDEPEISPLGPVARWSLAPDQGSAEVALRHAALHGIRSDFQELLPVALQAVQHALGDDENVSALAAARFSVLEEMDLDLSSAQGRTRQSQVGPYFGFLGKLGDEDPRNNPLYVTSLERLASCPWRSLLESTLRVAPPPDALAEIPAVDALLLGSMVHEVLEEIAQRGLPVSDSDSTGEARRLKDLLEAEAVPIPWPSTKVLEKILIGVVRKAALQLGVPEWEGLLLRRLQPIVERAKELDWEGGSKSVSCLGVEVQDDIVFRGSDDRELLLFFRADRVDRPLEGSALCLVDYKSGKSFFKNSTDKGRRSELLKAVASGTKLQAIVYALSGEGRTGVYQFLRPDGLVEDACFSVQADEEIEHALQSSVTVLWNGIRKGVYPPRLLDGKGVGASHCNHCSVSEACVKGDSSFRQRLLDVLGELSKSDLSSDSALESFQSLWTLSLGDPDASGISEERWLRIQHEGKGGSK